MVNDLFNKTIKYKTSVSINMNADFINVSRFQQCIIRIIFEDEVADFP